MAISTQELFDIKALKYGVSQQTDTFLVAFFFAYKMVINDLNSTKVGAGLGIAEDDIPENFETDLDIDSAYFNPISDMLDRYINDVGEWGQEDKESLRNKYRMALGRAQSIKFVADPPTTRNYQADTTEDEEEL